MSKMERQAAPRQPAVQMNTEKMTSLMNQVGRIFKTEGRVDMIISLFDELSKVYGVKKGTFYAVSSNYENVFKKI